MSQTDQLKSDIDELVPDLIAMRRDLHEHPELAFEELRTSGIVAQRLRSRPAAWRREQTWSQNHRHTRRHGCPPHSRDE